MRAQTLALILLALLFACVYTGIEYVGKVGTLFLATVILGRRSNTVLIRSSFAPHICE